ncbi:AEC family transporter [Psychrobacillus sp. NEAU-3TGS]|uniref:AEC family transporter n=1 Tax=Psychrobacillus sp. NEAU-3TGS TaxID=2995412 RepID=UPI0024995E42|nr:AEC family transporter [Psychrobacillus sp. NEAU-3TGS]MDI2589399.1 AEC family transporter [Psychrobacillus sp. NEAU-3TGS]
MDLLLIILPVFIIFFIGFLGQRLIGFDIKSISTAALYLMSPFLAFRTFYTHTLTIDYFYMVLACILLIFGLFLFVWLTARMLKSSRPQFAALMLGAAFPNSGNYGAPVVLFALGAVGFDYAVIIMVLHGLFINTFGIFFASLGGEEKASWRQSLQRVIRMPLIYAATLGIILQLVGASVPKSIMNGIGLVADASIPTVMLVLGMQLAVISRKKVAYRYVSVATVIRMVISPVIAALVVYFMPLNDMIKTVFIIQASMPTAANTTLLALQFGTEPDLVSFTTFVTTIISIITIPFVLFFLGI